MKDNEQKALQAQKLLEIKNDQLAKVDKKMSLLVVAQAAKDSELQYF